MRDGPRSTPKKQKVHGYPIMGDDLVLRVTTSDYTVDQESSLYWVNVFTGYQAGRLREISRQKNQHDYSLK